MNNNPIKVAIQSAHSSTVNGIDTNKAIDNVAAIVKVDIELLERALPELIALKSIHSNNPNKFAQLSKLIFEVEEQLYKFKG